MNTILLNIFDIIYYDIVFVYYVGALSCICGCPTQFRPLRDHGGGGRGPHAAGPTAAAVALMVRAPFPPPGRSAGGPGPWAAFKELYYNCVKPNSGLCQSGQGRKTTIHHLGGI